MIRRVENKVCKAGSKPNKWVDGGLPECTISTMFRVRWSASRNHRRGADDSIGQIEQTDFLCILIRYSKLEKEKLIFLRVVSIPRAMRLDGRWQTR